MHFTVSFRHEMEDSALAVNRSFPSVQTNPSNGKSKLRFKIDADHQPQPQPRSHPPPRPRPQIHTQCRSPKFIKTQTRPQPIRSPSLTKSQIHTPHRTNPISNTFDLTTLTSLTPLPTAQAEAEATFEQCLLEKSIRDLESRVRCRLKTPRLVIYEYIGPPIDDNEDLDTNNPVDEDLLLNDDDDDDEDDRTSPQVSRRVEAEVEVDPDPDDEQRQIHLSSLLISLRSPAFIASVGQGRGWKELIAMFVHLSARDLEYGLRPMSTGRVPTVELGSPESSDQGSLQGILKKSGRRWQEQLKGTRTKKNVSWGPVVTIQLQEHKEPRKTGFRIPGMGIIVEDLTESD